MYTGACCFDVHLCPQFHARDLKLSKESIWDFTSSISCQPEGFLFPTVASSSAQKDDVETRTMMDARRPDGGGSATARGKAAMATHKNNEIGMRGSLSTQSEQGDVDWLVIDKPFQAAKESVDPMTDAQHEATSS